MGKKSKQTVKSDLQNQTRKTDFKILKEKNNELIWNDSTTQIILQYILRYLIAKDLSRTAQVCK